MSDLDLLHDGPHQLLLVLGDVQGVVVRGKADVGLLISSGSHQCVHLEGFNVVTDRK